MNLKVKGIVMLVACIISTAFYLSAYGLTLGYVFLAIPLVYGAIFILNIIENKKNK